MSKGCPENQKHHWAHRLRRGSPLSPPLGLCVPPSLSTFLCHPFSAAFSLVFSLSHYPEIRRLFPPDADRADASHWVHSDYPQDFMAAVQGFLAPGVCWQRGPYETPERQGSACCSLFLYRSTQVGTQGHVGAEGVRPQTLMNKDTPPKVLG